MCVCLCVRVCYFASCSFSLQTLSDHLQLRDRVKRGGVKISTDTGIPREQILYTTEREREREMNMEEAIKVQIVQKKTDRWVDEMEKDE